MDSVDVVIRDSDPIRGTTDHAGAGRADYGLTRKQREALLAAWHAGSDDVPREADRQEFAATLGISHQSLAQRLRRGIHGLLAGTLVGPDGGGTVAGPVGGFDTDS